jgi:eukaryotic-like serine/threonine-protein kinase
MRPSLDRDRWQRIGEVLDAALAREPEHWPSVLDATCVGAPDLRREVEDLLDRVGDARGFLESRPTAAAAAVIAEAFDGREPGAGHRIGAYSIVREIGRGGMSRVFLARRADGHFEQHVALKLLRPGLDTEIDRARFRAERQILASLNHPNIARLLDGGLTDAGQPYLVLEYVEGQPIDAYCDERSLTVRQRLDLFLAAAEATQHAHRNLIVHRDLKSSNIFVSVDGVVKLLDFGLAKLLEPSVSSGESAATRSVAHWMTPEYAAPEQIRRELVTTLTDVYQLGAVLYRLLSGRLPFIAPHGDLRELEAAVLRGDPTPPSVAVANSDPGRAKLLRGDLDAIVLKALRSEPSERFASVEAMADDLRRHLSGHPVLARRVTAAYRARRFVRRHRVETIAALGILVSVLAGAGFSLRQARRAATERDLATIASRESQAVTSFVLGLFEASDPAETRGDTLTAVELVRRAAARAEHLRGQPLAQARMLEVTGRLYQSLGQYAEAYATLQRAIDIRRHTRPGDAVELAGALGQLTDVLVKLGRYAAADSAAREAMEIQQRALGPEHPALAITLHQIASISVYRGDLSVAEGYQRQALAVRQKALGPNDSLTAESHLSLGAILRIEGRMSDAEREFRSGLAILERSVSPDAPQLAGAMLDIAYLLAEVRGRYAEAEPLYHRALDIRRRAFGDGHPMVAATLLDFAEFLSTRGDRIAAVTPARQGVDIVRRAYGREHPVVADFQGRLAAILYRAGDLDEAAALFQQSIAMDRRLRGPDHENITGLEIGLARIRIDRREYAGADSLIRAAIEIRKRASGPTHPVTAATQGFLGMLLTREGKYAAADSILRLSLQTMERQVGREHPDVRELYGWLAELRDAQGRHADAIQYRAIANAR